MSIFKYKHNLIENKTTRKTKNIPFGVQLVLSPPHTPHESSTSFTSGGQEMAPLQTYEFKIK
jgi:hypothetical protein